MARRGSHLIAGYDCSSPLQVKQPSLSAWLPIMMAAPEDTAASAPPSDVAPTPSNFSFDTARPAAQDIHQQHTQQVCEITHHETQSLPGNPQMWAGWAKRVQLLAACMCLPTACSLQVHALWPNHPPLPSHVTAWNLMQTAWCTAETNLLPLPGVYHWSVMLCNGFSCSRHLL